MSINFKGVIPPMITPFTAAGDVDYGKFEKNMNKWNDSALCGYLVLGSNSETAYLTEAEKLKLVELTKKTAKKDRIIIAGTGMETDTETIALTNKAADLGVEAALILTPCYYGSAMSAPALINYFTKVAEGSKIPIMLYNVPKFTHVNIPDAALKTLANHPNIIGMKDSTGDIGQLVRFQGLTVDADFQILVGTASAWYPALTLGVKAGIFALANSNPNELAKIQELFEKGAQGEAVDLFRKMFVLNTAVTATYGIPGLKYAASLLGYEGGYVRCPLLELSEDKKEELKEIFREYI
ncbi:MAG: dihydrodipicolinate synthase family protein [Defluviitaleaceae bacterium]|nr:dihydrodipicolinate synthase family protein [Defluviitaleaceae bacterium]